MILRSTILALGVAAASVLAAPQVATAQTEGEMAPHSYNPWTGEGGSRGDRGRWRDDRWREPPPPRPYPRQDYYRPAPSYGGPNCRVVYSDDGWGGRRALRECQVCEPVWVRDSWGNSYRENRCRRVVQRLD
jgi:hypothetical protein